MFQQPLIITLLLGTVWKTIDLVRAPRNRILRVLVACLFLLTLGQILSLPGPTRWIDTATAAGVGAVAFNAVHMSGLCALILVFLAASDLDRDTYRRRLRGNLALLAGVVVAMGVDQVATPAALRTHTLTGPHMAQPAVALFYVIGNGYFIYAYVMAGRSALSYARRAAQHLALGLRLMTLGLAGLALASVNRLVWVYLQASAPGRHLAFNTLNWSINDWSLAVVIVGICFAAAAQLVTAWRTLVHHRRVYVGLTPLWTLVASAYPELILDPAPANSWWHRFQPRRTHQLFYRRLIECRDGLVRLSPYLARVSGGGDLAHGPAEELAGHIIEALAVKPPVEDPETQLAAMPVAMPDERATGLDADIRELLTVSDALKGRLAWQR